MFLKDIKRKIFCRGETTTEEKEMIERSKTTNPDEIDLDGDFDSDEDEKVEGN